MPRIIGCALLSLMALSACKQSTETSTAGRYAYFADDDKMSAINLDIALPSPTVIASTPSNVPDVVRDLFGTHRTTYVLAYKNAALPARGRGFIFLANHRLWAVDFEVEKPLAPRQLSQDYIETICTSAVMHDTLYYRTSPPLEGLSNACPTTGASNWRKVDLDTTADAQPTEVTALPDGNISMLYNPETGQKQYLAPVNDGIAIFNADFIQTSTLPELKYIEETRPISNRKGVFLIHAKNSQHEETIYLFNMNNGQLLELIGLQGSEVHWSATLQAFVMKREQSGADVGLIAIDADGHIEPLTTFASDSEVQGYRLYDDAIVYQEETTAGNTAYSIDIGSPSYSRRLIYSSKPWLAPHRNSGDLIQFTLNSCLESDQLIAPCLGYTNTAEGYSILHSKAIWLTDSGARPVPGGWQSNYRLSSTNFSEPYAPTTLAQQQPSGDLKIIAEFSAGPAISLFRQGRRHDMLMYAQGPTTHLMLIDTVRKKSTPIAHSDNAKWLGEMLPGAFTWAQ